MKTATVRELRNNFARLAKWIEHGEQITITKNGQSFAKLSPATTDKPRKVDWAARFRKAKTARARIISQGDGGALVEAARLACGNGRLSRFLISRLAASC